MFNVRSPLTGGTLPASLRSPGSGWTTLDYTCAVVEAGVLLTWAPVLVLLPLWVSAFMAPLD
jgi:hypothetical protein